MCATMDEVTVIIYSESSRIYATKKAENLNNQK